MTLPAGGSRHPPAPSGLSLLLGVGQCGLAFSSPSPSRSWGMQCRRRAAQWSLSIAGGEGAAGEGLEPGETEGAIPTVTTYLVMPSLPWSLLGSAHKHRPGGPWYMHFCPSLFFTW